MANKFDLGVFIGRFQPFHKGHLSVIQEGLKYSNNLIIFAGSANGARCHRNPFTYNERKYMIETSLTPDERKRVTILPLEDVSYNDTQWIQSVQEGVAQVSNSISPNSELTVALVGHSKDASSYYLKMFPQWGSIEAPNYMMFNSTHIRNSYFSNIGDIWLKNADGHREGDLDREKIITPKTKEFLAEFLETPVYKQICREYEYIQNYRADWEIGKPIKYPVIFSTVDAVVTQGGHVLLIRRRSEPGKGLWAMPGGFLNPTEFIVDGMIRELLEETGLKIPEKVLRGSIKHRDVFDDPNRSSRGRIITHAFLIKLEDTTTLPRVKGMDDADKAKWIPISTIKRKGMFEDHFDIVHNMLGKLKKD